MCTAITFQGSQHFFGRNLDLDFSYREEVVITPRQFPLSFHQVSLYRPQLAMIGMATISQDYPLYYEATNESGLSMAGLNFPHNAVYFPPKDGKYNVAPYELIPWILGQCHSVAEAMPLLENLNITAIPFSQEFPLAPLHWILADQEQALTIESTKTGLTIHQNPYGVLTNNPPFPYHAENVNQYLHLTAGAPENQLAPVLPLAASSLGVGAVGLPGDLSSPSRFIRAVFTKWNAQSCQAVEEDISQFFHILGSVAFTAGCVVTQIGTDKTIYTSCCNTNTGIYYYTTYNNSQITAVSLHQVDLDSDGLFRYPMRKTQQFQLEN